tara:strand:+ start:513 stop:1265 length:753 start_codon:yes stop_codon:yes gene_type:complete
MRITSFFIVLLLAFNVSASSKDMNQDLSLDFLNEQYILYFYNEAVIESDENVQVPIGFDAFKALMNAQHRYGKKTRYVGLVEFSDPSTAERFLIVDTIDKRIVLSTYLPHAVNSGTLYAVDFSNERMSHKNSLGAYKATKSYVGKSGLALKLKGMVDGLNDNAFKRNITINGSRQADPKRIEENGMLGFTKGDFSLPFDKLEEAIGYLENGSIVVAYKSMYYSPSPEGFGDMFAALEEPDVANKLKLVNN